MSFDRTFDESALFRICFVCTGNICRSPIAETIFKSIVKKAGFEKQVAVMSAGTGDWHVGEPSDERTLAALKAHGYNGAGHRARQFDPSWFSTLDLVVVFLVTHPLVYYASRSEFLSRPSVNGLGGVSQIAQERRHRGSPADRSAAGSSAGTGE